ncbi:BREX-1 system phosphatase PglZ type B [Azospirillum argentinense]|uniref:BREX-1 system phosphatase PglZ type B n=1 Tax=Azospirillum brasilense TaxID=192 RepID=A0A4D8Q6Q9_AZOBR|nr:BREX-1 system phosphatase PglZ type B [Azospirillum argentinense]QCO03440.1 BREX-1 system phosphatase PglZ type B [Azospirillum argentinense]
MSQTLLDAVQESLASVLRVPDGVAAPVAILWTDPDAQWQPVLPALRRLVPQIYVLGTYEPAVAMGPAIWLKCVVDRSIPEAAPPAGAVPVLYLPKVARSVLRSAEDCPPALAPLVELQYRGAVWHQRNGRDWTVEAFTEAVLGLDVARDARTRQALLHMLPRVAAEPLVALQGRRLDADDFHRLAVDDPTGDLLAWMNDPAGFRQRCDEARWESFRQLCLRSWGFDPVADGVATAAERLVNDTGKEWSTVWRRFCQAPKLYPGLSKPLGMAYSDLFGSSSRHPRFNEESENRLRGALEAAAGLPQAEACERVLALEAEHGERRDSPWAALGRSPLADVLEPLARLARLARSPLGGASVPAVAAAYAADGWRCDQAALDVLEWMRTAGDGAAVAGGVLRALYLPWLDLSARHLQDLLAMPGVDPRALASGVEAEPGTCVLFADGLRYDVGMRLKARLEERGLPVRGEHRFAPLPTVTATAKPLATPVHGGVAMGGVSDDFAPPLADSGHPATAQRLRDAMARRGMTVLDGDEVAGPAAPDAAGWAEVGRLDELGHSLGCGVAREVEIEVETIAGRIEALLTAGWRRVRVVTDHGWLLLPGGLPKVSLPASVAAARWARCAALKAGATPEALTVPWHWNQHAAIAVPPGVGSFLAGTDYAHGGVSVQECVVPELVVEAGAAAVSARIATLSWRGMRLRVAVETASAGLMVDLRLNRNQPATSIVAAPKALGANGEASLVVEDDRHEHAAAAMVVLDGAGAVLDWRTTTVGDDS